MAKDRLLDDGVGDPLDIDAELVQGGNGVASQGAVLNGTQRYEPWRKAGKQFLPPSLGGRSLSFGISRGLH
jgi:hypothetical protein